MASRRGNYRRDSRSRSPRGRRRGGRDHHAGEEHADIAFWEHGPDKDLEFTSAHGDVLLQFQATLILPAGQQPPPRSRDQKYPLVIFFGDMDSPRGIRDLGPEKFQQIITLPFVLAAPLRRPGTWWVLDNDNPDWGFVDGAFMENVAADYVEWIRVLSQEQSIDQDFISLVGFSAGAYAAVEVMCINRAVNFRGVLLGALHGHSQPNPPERKRGVALEEAHWRWEDFLRRIHDHERPPQVMCAVHHPDDSRSPWDDAKIIYQAVNERRHFLGMRPAEVDFICDLSPKSKKRNFWHEYHDRAIFHAMFLERILPRGRGSSTRRVVDQGWQYEAADLNADFVDEPADEAHRRGASQHPDPGGSYSVGGEAVSGRHVQGLAKVKREPPWRQERCCSEDSRRQSRGRSRSPLIPPAAYQERHGSKWQDNPAAKKWKKEKAWKEEKCETYQDPHPPAFMPRPPEREGLMCAVPGCPYLIHSDPQFGGYCCRKCHWRYDTGSKSKVKHGAACEKLYAEEGAPRAEPIEPEDVEGQ